MEGLSINLLCEVLKLLTPKEVVKLEVVSKKLRHKLVNSGNFLWRNCFLTGFCCFESSDYLSFKTKLKEVTKYTLAFTSGDSVKFWDLEKVQEVARFQGGSCLCLSKDKKLIAFGNKGGIEVWSLETQERVKVFEDTENINSVSISHGNIYLASGGLDGKVRVWNLFHGQSLYA